MIYLGSQLNKMCFTYLSATPPFGVHIRGSEFVNYSWELSIFGDSYALGPSSINNFEIPLLNMLWSSSSSSFYLSMLLFEDIPPSMSTTSATTFYSYSSSWLESFCDSSISYLLLSILSSSSKLRLLLNLDKPWSGLSPVSSINID